MDEIKKRKVTEKDFALLQDAKKLEDDLRSEQAVYQRKQNLLHAGVQLRALLRQKEHKMTQLSGSVVEKHDEFVDGKKPVFVLKSEVDEMNYRIDAIAADVKRMHEEMKERGDDIPEVVGIDSVFDPKNAF